MHSRIPAVAVTWHQFAHIFIQRQLPISGDMVKAVLGRASDFVRKLDTQPCAVPQLLFDEQNCDFYDQIRPLIWKDPTELVRKNF